MRRFSANAKPDVNLILHLVNVCLVYLWLSRLRVGSGVAVAVTLVFAVHPVQNESVK